MVLWASRILRAVNGRQGTKVGKGSEIVIFEAVTTMAAAAVDRQLPKGPLRYPRLALWYRNRS